MFCILCPASCGCLPRSLHSPLPVCTCVFVVCMCLCVCVSVCARARPRVCTHTCARVSFCVKKKTRVLASRSHLLTGRGENRQCPKYRRCHAHAWVFANGCETSTSPTPPWAGAGAAARPPQMLPKVRKRLCIYACVCVCVCVRARARPIFFFNLCVGASIVRSHVAMVLCWAPAIFFQTFFYLCVGACGVRRVRCWAPQYCNPERGGRRQRRALAHACERGGGRGGVTL